MHKVCVSVCVCEWVTECVCWLPKSVIWTYRHTQRIVLFVTDTTFNTYYIYIHIIFVSFSYYFLFFASFRFHFACTKWSLFSASSSYYYYYSSAFIAHVIGGHCGGDVRCSRRTHNSHSMLLTNITPFYSRNTVLSNFSYLVYGQIRPICYRTYSMCYGMATAFWSKYSTFNVHPFFLLHFFSGFIRLLLRFVNKPTTNCNAFGMCENELKHTHIWITYVKRYIFSWAIRTFI